MTTVSECCDPPARAVPVKCRPTTAAKAFLRASGCASPTGPSAGFPDAYVFVALAVAVVAAAALINGAPAVAVAASFGDGFWSLIIFTMQMVMVVVSGYVVASSPPAAKLIDGLAGMPRSGRGAVPFVAAVSMLTSLLNWGMSLVFSAACWCARSPGAPICAWIIAPPAPRPISASGRPGRWA